MCACGTLEERKDVCLRNIGGEKGCVPAEHWRRERTCDCGTLEERKDVCLWNIGGEKGRVPVEHGRRERTCACGTWEERKNVCLRNPDTEKMQVMWVGKQRETLNLRMVGGRDYKEVIWCTRVEV